MTPYLVFFCLVPAICTSLSVSKSLDFKILTTWDGTPIDNPNDAARIKLSTTEDNQLQVEVSARFYNSPEGPPYQKESCPQRTTSGLWKREGIEVFFLNGENQYIQLQFVPRGQYKVLLLSDSRDYELERLPLNTTVENNCEEAGDSCGRWKVTALIPMDYLPPNITRFNAIARHGPNDNEKEPDYKDFVFESLNPVDPSILSEPDFHYLEPFQDIDLEDIGFQQSASPSPIWQEIISGRRHFNISYQLFHQNDCQVSPAGNGGRVTLTRQSGVPGIQDRLRVHVEVDDEGGLKPQHTDDHLTFTQLREALFVSFTNKKNQTTKVILNPVGGYEIHIDAEMMVPEHRKSLETVDCQQRTSTQNGYSWSCDFEIRTDLLPSGIRRMQLALVYYPLNGGPLVMSTYCPNGHKNRYDNLDQVGCAVDPRSVVSELEEEDDAEEPMSRVTLSKKKCPTEDWSKDEEQQEKE